MLIFKSVYSNSWSQDSPPNTDMTFLTSKTNSEDNVADSSWLFATEGSYSCGTYDYCFFSVTYEQLSLQFEFCVDSGY